MAECKHMIAIGNDVDCLLCERDKLRAEVERLRGVCTSVFALVEKAAGTAVVEEGADYLMKASDLLEYRGMTSPESDAGPPTPSGSEETHDHVNCDRGHVEPIYCAWCLAEGKKLADEMRLEVAESIARRLAQER